MSDSRKRETPYRGKVTVFPINGLAKEEGKGDEKDFSLRSK